MKTFKNLVDKLNQASAWEETIWLERNEYLTVNGKKDTNLYFIVEGSLRIFVLDELEEHTIRLAYKDNLITALDAFISEQPSELYIQAIKKSQLLRVSKKNFLEFINSSLENTKLWMEILSHMVIQQMERERDILTSSPVERYKRVLKRSPHLFQEIPNKYIASYLRMTPETLSRIKKS